MWGDNDRQLEAVGDIGNKGRQDGKAGIPSNKGTQEGRECEREDFRKADAPSRTGALVGRQ